MNLRVTVVEDEPPILRDIVSLLESIPCVLEVETARNGEEAIATIRRRAPDLLITDIRMPVMDGLELLQEAKREEPQLHTAIITGYDEFEYAKTACNLGTERFLLKPLDEAELNDLVKQVALSVDAECRSAVSDLFADRAVSSEGRSTLSRLEFAQAIGCAIIPGFFRSRTVGHDGLRADDERLERWSAALNHRLGADGRVWLVSSGHGGMYYLVAVTSRTGRDRIDELLRRAEQLVRADVRDFYTIVVGGPRESLAEVADHMSQLGSSLGRFVIPYRGRVVDADKSLPSIGPEGEVLDASMETYLSTLCANGDCGPFVEELSGVLSDLARSGSNQLVFERCIRRFVRVANRGIVFAEAPDEAMLESEAVEALYESTDIDEATASLEAFFRKLFSRRVTDLSNLQLVRRVEEYLRRHYAEPIDCQLLGRLFDRVPHYLSSTYKRHKRLSPTEHLRQIRIDAAKRIFEENPHMPAKDVACSVGFGDQSYFSKVFRATEGMTPQEYRRSLRNGVAEPPAKPKQTG